MSANIVFIVAIQPGKHLWRRSHIGRKGLRAKIDRVRYTLRPPRLHYTGYAIDSWHRWAAAHDNIDVYVHDTPRMDPDTVPPPWQRWQCLDILEQAGLSPEKILIVDADTIIHPDAPDIFSVHREQGIHACPDNGNAQWIEKSIAHYRELFPDVTLTPGSYFNSGVFLIEKTAFPHIEGIRSYYEQNRQRLNDKAAADLGIDQTVLNFLTRQQGMPLHLMDERYNLQHIRHKGLMKDDGTIDPTLTDKAWIFHFNGMPWAQREKYMRRFSKQLRTLKAA